MLSFECDYNTGAHPKLLEALAKTNLEPQPGYGEDEYCARAADRIREACRAPEAEVRFLVGGTQTNQIVIASLLRSYEGVLSAVTGHVNGHEAGAIEYSGHKVLTLPQHEGKIDAGELRAWLETYFGDEAYEHMVRPGMVYVSRSCSCTAAHCLWFRRTPLTAQKSFASSSPRRITRCIATAAAVRSIRGKTISIASSPTEILSSVKVDGLQYCRFQKEVYGWNRKSTIGMS